MAEHHLSLIRSALSGYFQGLGLCVAKEEPRSHDHPVALLSIQKCAMDSAGLGDYLGISEQDGEELEVYGKRCSLTVALDFFAPASGGKGLLTKETDLVLDCLAKGDSSSLKLREFSMGAVSYDKSTGCYCQALELKMQVYFYFVENILEPLIEFNIKGVLKNGN